MTSPRNPTLPLLGAGALLVAPGAVALLTTATPASATGTTFTVTNLNPSGAGSLADAVAQANLTTDADTIVFDPSLNGSIMIGGTLTIDEDLTIDGDDRITLDGGDAHRIIQLAENGERVVLSRLVLTHGRADSGGAVYSHSNAELVGDHLTVSDNVATGTFANGAITMGTLNSPTSRLSLTDSLITGNTRDVVGNSHTGATGIFFSSYNSVEITRTSIMNNVGLKGGGADIWSRALTVTDSIVSNNTATYGPTSVGGLSIAAPELTIDGLTMAGNSGISLRSSGTAGTISSFSNLTVRGGTTGVVVEVGGPTTISHTTVTGTTGTAISVSTCDAGTTIESSTIAGNLGLGVAVRLDRGSYYCTSNTAVLEHSTVAHNGVGIDSTAYATEIRLDHTVVAQNVTDLADDATAEWSLIGDPNGHLLPASTNTITGVDPNLSPLVFLPDAQGGTGPGTGVCTFDETSAAFDAGDPAFTPPPDTDQLGRPRVAFGRIDIGAWELPDPTPPPTSTTSTTEGGDPVVPAFTG